MPALAPTDRALLEAVSFAARAHHGQVRKDGRTPYASHVARVCLILRHVFQLDDAAMLTAGVLHDTIEDTTTDFDDLAERFGPEVAAWVSALSKDKRLRDEARETAYCSALSAAPWQVKACKLADLCDNLLDALRLTDPQRRSMIRRAHSYLDALEHPELPSNLRNARAIVGSLLAELEATLG